MESRYLWKDRHFCMAHENLDFFLSLFSFILLFTIHTTPLLLRDQNLVRKQNFGDVSFFSFFKNIQNTEK